MSETEARTEKIDARLTPREKEMVRRAAQKTQRKLSDWVRWKLLRGLREEP